MRDVPRSALSEVGWFHSVTTWYRVRIRGHLDPAWSAWFGATQQLVQPNTLQRAAAALAQGSNGRSRASFASLCGEAAQYMPDPGLAAYWPGAETDGH